jgi:hypothetical protein
MLRRNVRLRKEYLLKKTVESKENALRERREKVKRLVESGEVGEIIPASKITLNSF